MVIAIAKDTVMPVIAWGLGTAMQADKWIQGLNSQTVDEITNFFSSTLKHSLTAENLERLAQEIPGHMENTFRNMDLSVYQNEMLTVAALGLGIGYFSRSENASVRALSVAAACAAVYSLNADTLASVAIKVAAGAILSKSISMLFCGSGKKVASKPHYEESESSEEDSPPASGNTTPYGSSPPASGNTTPYGGSPPASGNVTPLGSKSPTFSRKPPSME